MTLFLPRFHMEKPGCSRPGSPPGGSILITSAPKSAMNMPVIGPAIPSVRSTTCSVPSTSIEAPLPGGEFLFLVAYSKLCRVIGAVRAGLPEWPNAPPAYEFDAITVALRQGGRQRLDQTTFHQCPGLRETDQ